jgi:hypothetical protein
MTTLRPPPTAPTPSVAKHVAHDMATAVRLGDPAAIAACQRLLGDLEARSCGRAPRRSRRSTQRSCDSRRS